jgi:hypothetical protein
MEVYGQEVTGLMDECVKFFFAEVLSQQLNAAPQELQDSIFFFIQFVEKCKRDSDPMMNYELTTQFTDIATKAPQDLIEVRQNAVYGIGVMAKFTARPAFASILPSAKTALLQTIASCDQSDEAQKVVIENAQIALGFLSVYQSQ